MFMKFLIFCKLAHGATVYCGCVTQVCGGLSHLQATASSCRGLQLM